MKNLHRLNYFFKLSSDNDSMNNDDSERKKQILERYLRMLDKKQKEGSNNIKNIVSWVKNLSEEERQSFADKISNIDYSVFSSKYPDEDFFTSKEDILDSIVYQEKSNGFFAHPEGQPDKICGYIYGSVANNYIDNYEFNILMRGISNSQAIASIKNKLPDIKKAFKDKKIFYVENLAATMDAGCPNLSGSILMIEIAKELKSKGYRYIFADFLEQSAKLISSSRDSQLFKSIGLEVIFNETLPLDYGEVYPRSKILIEIK